jgi:acyl-coenzyme A synthetase/AMP-(fatty) acid ligase
MFGKHYNIWKSKFPEAMFINLYGPTEVTVDCTYYVVNRGFEDNDVIPIGRNCNNKSVFLLDENGQIIEGEGSGELAVRGTGLALGYYNNREQTDKVFVQNPLHSHYRDLIYKTGDHVRINKFNEIEFIGRKDFQIKHMGNRIELGEIEAAVYAINSVQHAACVYDLKNEKIVLFYSAVNLISPVDFIKELSARIPKYMIPNRFEFMQEMPINANGKVDKKAIKEMLND